MAVSVTVGVARSAEEIAAFDANAAAQEQYKLACATAAAENKRAPPKPPDTSKETEETLRKKQVERARQLRDRCIAAGEECRFVGIDPGIKAPFTAVVHSDAAEASQVHFEVITARKKEWNAKLGFTRYTKKVATWIANDPAVKTFNETVASAKTASLATYSSRITTVLEAFRALMWFYVERVRVRREKFGRGIRSQQGLDHFADKITGGKKNTVVAFGDACRNPRVRGHAPVSTNKLRRTLSRKCVVGDVDEFRTSMCCSQCHEKMEGLRVRVKAVARDGQEMVPKYKRLYGVRCCESSTCQRKLWNRDVNGAINILNRFLRDVREQPHPDVFLRRGATLEPVAELPVDGAALEEEEEVVEERAFLT